MRPIWDTSYHPNEATAHQVGDPLDNFHDPLRKKLNWNTVYIIIWILFFNLVISLLPFGILVWISRISQRSYKILQNPVGFLPRYNFAPDFFPGTSNAISVQNRAVLYPEPSGFLVRRWSQGETLG